jgi:hypothetical protein
MENNTQPQNTNNTIVTDDFIMSLAKNWNPPIKKKTGRKSKLSPYLNAIRYMRSARHLSYKEIHAFVLDSGTSISYPTLMNFITKNFHKKKNKKKN